MDAALDFLPLPRVDKDLSLGEGDTPCLRLHNLEKKFHIPWIWAKDETANPTHSFKDRGTFLAIQMAVRAGVLRIGTVSTGNMAVSTAAYGARAGLETFVLLKENAPPLNRAAAGAYSAHLIEVKGNYGELFRKSFSIGRDENIYFMNSVDPFRIEGYKVTAFEIFLQLGRKAPDFVFVPVSSGGHMIGLIKGWEELRQAGFIRKCPFFVGVQTRGCAPIAAAFEMGRLEVQKVKKPRTIAKAISNPDPPGGRLLLWMLRKRPGAIMGVSDTRLLKAQRELAEHEGLFVQPASAAAFAAVLEFARKKRFTARNTIVMILTGSGFKALDDASPPAVKRTDLKRLHNAIRESLSPCLSPSRGNFSKP
ncbi:MAG: threonine synthase [Candidatus Aminicenantales bacterium]